MLAQNFLSARKLGLCQAVLQAHIDVLNMLERDELKHILDAQLRAKQRLFDMETIFEQTSCGTVGCIGGYVLERLFPECRSFGRADLVGLVSTKAQENLYHPPILIYIGEGIAGPKHVCYANITTAEAAAALRNYLVTGEPNWREVLG